MKLLKRIFLGMLIVLVALVVFLVGSVAVDYAVGGDRVMSLANTIVPGANGEPDVLAYVAKPDGEGPFPAVIMIHEFFGLNESIIGKAEGLADEGYYVVAPDTFRGSTTTWIPHAIYQVISTKQENVNADLDSIYAWLESQPEVADDRIAIAGFCYGGRASLLYSLHNNKLAATVVFYGSPETDPEVLKNLPGPLLGIFGGADQSISVEDVNAFVLGGHGDSMVPLARYSTVAGIPITELMSQATIDRLVTRARNGGIEIVNFLKTGSAYYAPSASTVLMAESIIKDKRRILPCAVYLQGEYGINDNFVGVPVKLGKRGIEDIIQIKLNADEQAALNKSAEEVKSQIAKLKL